MTTSLRFTLALSGLMLLLGLFPGWSEPLLEFDRSAIQQGQIWRLITGQLIHYGFYHLAMNLAALILIGWALLRHTPLLTYLILLSICLLTVGLGLYVYATDTTHYAGFSGALHGLLVGGLILTIRETPIFNALALMVVIAKLVHEQLPGFDTHHALLPVPVAIEAHLLGALAGLGCSVTMMLISREKQPTK